MRPSRAWILLLLIAGGLAAVAVGHWIDALVTGRPVLYGEGAVANAAILLRDGNPYAPRAEFVAANYPPLYLLMASLGDPFRAGRIVSMLAAAAVAVIIWRRARPAGIIPSVALGLAWLALAPVAIWGPVVKPDMLAVALTLGGVTAIDRAMRTGLGTRGGSAQMAMLGGALFAAAIWAKPTALLPAAAVLALMIVAARPLSLRALNGFAAIGLVAVAHAATFGIGDVWRHVVVWNALPWSAVQAGSVLLVGAATIGIIVATAARTRAFGGIALAYALGAFGVALLGGREGSTINYLLDACAATMYALATVAPRTSASVAIPVSAAAQVVLGLAILAPFGLIPGRDPGTGAWGAPERVNEIRLLEPGERYLVEDSGLLIAAGMRPVIDDVFLYSRLLDRGEVGPALATGLIGAGEYAAIVTEVDLERYDETAAFGRTRWHPLIVREIITRYRPAGARVVDSRTVLWVYRPR